MFLSKLVINTSNPIGLRSLIDPYEAHRTIWRGFPNAVDDGPGRVLFRLEHRKNPPYLVALVQSCLEPNWQPLLQGNIILSAESKEFTLKIIEDLTRVGQLLHFRLKANPTARKIVDDSQRDEKGRPKRGRVGIFGEDRQKAWLAGKAAKGGFKLVECYISAKEDSNSSKPSVKEKIKHLAVTFEGILEVTDTEIFHATLEQGIGSAKGFGFGLLSIARYRR